MNISEVFYSVQAEGPTVGIPAAFIRLYGCNLHCGYLDPNTLNPNATWKCDTWTIWRQKTEMSNEILYEKINTLVPFEKVTNGIVHLVWTGGEPLLSKNQKDLNGFLDFLENKCPPNHIYNEMETNGTLSLNDDTFRRIQQINCSPKLSNSGMDYKTRIHLDVLSQINLHPNSNFKFVISEEKDIEEIQKDILDPVGIDPRKVCIMPGVDNRDQLAERTRFLFELTKKYGYRGITRQQILAWDRQLGV